MSYSGLVVIGLGGAAALDLWLLRTRLLMRKAFWVAYAIMFGFQLIVNAIVRVSSIGIHGWAMMLSVNGPFGKSVENGITK